MYAGIEPRPDLSVDSGLWITLLTIVVDKYGNESELFGNLKGMRACGARLVKGCNGNYSIRPIVDPLGAVGFYPGEYEEMRDKYLQQYVKQITGLLKQLEQRERRTG